MKILSQHIIPCICALVVGYCFYQYKFSKSKLHNTLSIIRCKGEQKLIYDNFDTIPEGITPFLSCLKDKENIMLLGSSELTTSSPLIPYQYFNQKIHQPLTAFGHAFYQSFSMYCNLLAFKNDLKNKKICIIISPGWFETKGTNTESFLEFVRPEMLSCIIQNIDVTKEELLPLCTYINKNENNFLGLSSQMEYLSLFNEKLIPLKQAKVQQLKSKIGQFQFEICTSTPSNEICIEPNWNEVYTKCKSSFRQKCTNPYFIEDDLFREILSGKKEFKKRDFKPLALENNQEYKDFKELIQLLKRTGANPIFVIQGLLPFGYEHLERFNEISSAIKNDLSDLGFPCLDLFEPNELKYQPGTLKDFAHMGDLGWSRVNEFIFQNFCNEKIH